MKYKVLTIVLFAVVTFVFMTGLFSYNRKLDEMLGKEITQVTAQDLVVVKGSAPEETEEEPVVLPGPLEEVMVPSLLGLSEEEALSELMELGLTADREEAYDGEAEEGRVFSQMPDAQTLVAPGEIIGFVVSLGADPDFLEEEQIIVPNLIGMSKEAAEAELLARGFQVEHEYNPSEHYEEGYVYSQNYKVDAEVDLGTMVKIRISTGN